MQFNEIGENTGRVAVHEYGRFIEEAMVLKLKMWEALDRVDTVQWGVSFGEGDFFTHIWFEKTEVANISSGMRLFVVSIDPQKQMRLLAVKIGDRFVPCYDSQEKAQSVIVSRSMD